MKIITAFLSGFLNDSLKSITNFTVEARSDIVIV